MTAQTGEEPKTGRWQVSRVPPEATDLVWGQIEPLAEKGLRQIRDDSLTTQDIRARLHDARYLLWVVHDEDCVTGVLVLSVNERVRGRVLFVVLVAGQGFRDWSPLAQELLQDYAALIGAKKIESHSRPGMEKWMRDLGWRKRAVIMEWTDGQ